MAAWLTTACSSSCDEFYDTYEECGFTNPGEDVDASRDACNEQTDQTDACSAGYDALVDCISELDDVCGYPDACSEDLHYAYAACG